MEGPLRIIIPACIGCKAMRQEEVCDGGCSERKLELVSGDDYDELAAASADCRARVQGLRAVAGELARTEPGPGEWQAAYEALQRSARAGLRRYRPAPDGPGGPGDPLPAADTVTVWRCPDCGSVDAPQECIGVCIWHAAEWVDATAYEAERVRAAADQDAERALARLLRTLAYVTPRDRALGTELACPASGGAAARRSAHTAGGRAPAGRRAVSHPASQAMAGSTNAGLS